MPERSAVHSLLRRVLARWPQSAKAGLALVDVQARAILWPFRRRPLRGRPTESAQLLEGTSAYNAAAERYFAESPNPQFLLDKPFSEADGLAQHLINVGVLIEAMRLRPGDVVVELGAGSCWLSHMLNLFGCTTVAVDVSSTALALGRLAFERDPRTRWDLEPQFVAYDGVRLPLPDGHCDRVVVNDAFHHVPNQRQLLAEMHRILKPDGLVAMSEPGAGHASTHHSVAESASGVLENELVLEDIAALAESCGFRHVSVVLSAPTVHAQIPARELGAFMGGRGFAAYWKVLCSGLEQHHYIVCHKNPPALDTRRPATLSASITALMPRALTTVVREPVPLVLRVVNRADTTWLARQGRGWTRVGAHLYTAGASRTLVDFDWVRVALPRDVEPGEQIDLDVQLPGLDEPGSYEVVFDVVIEGIAWFADRGSATHTMPLTVTATREQAPA
jgi:SAM-dependent methyltransferase